MSVSMPMSPPATGADAAVEARVRHFARVQPDAAAVIGLHRTITYRELDEAADRAATALARYQVAPGSRVAWLGRNDIGYVITMLGTRRRGACLAGLNWREQPAELRRACALIAPTVLVADSANAGAATSVGEEAGAVITLSAESIPWDEELSDPAAVLTAGDGDDCMLYFTSGSTGRPKAVVHQYNRVNRNIVSLLPGFEPGAVTLIIPPVFHVAGAVWVQHTLISGATMVFPRDGSTILQTISDFGVTHALMVPTLIQMMLAEQAASGLEAPRLRVIAYGTSPITSTLLRSAMDRFRCSFIQCYGTTEAGGVMTMLGADDHQLGGPHAGRMASAGVPLPGFTVQAVQPGTRRACKSGQTGELRVRTPLAMSGYWGDPEATAAVLDADGWLHTRDLGYLDEDGYVYVVGRLDDVIITGGENVHPAEVENVLSGLPGLAAACVTGVPDERWGQVVAVAVVRVDAALSEQQVLGHCRAHLAHYKCPRLIVFMDELPRNATGKVIRSHVRNQIVDGLSRRPPRTEAG
jgi:acyl-CoA synthetase (AMP-forming)/AMP-acid ligase II